MRAAARNFGWIVLMALGGCLGAVAQENTCVDCHAALEGKLQVTETMAAADVHTHKGLTCVSCHGGDAAEPSMDSMARQKGFRGKLSKSEIVKVCGECHADAGRMRSFNPSLRTDQLAQFMTSGHGTRLRKGDAKVAVCTDCHGVHGIRPPADPASKVHPLNVAETCGHCHSDREYMKGRNRPTDQYAGYQASVHHEALTKRGDLSAPTCSTCHGNHGAAPPGVSSVENVCSNCHVSQAELFDKSRHKEVFAAIGSAPCITCHSNHRITRPTDAMIGTGQQSVCLTCHAEGDAGYAAGKEIQLQLAGLQSEIIAAEELLARAARAGMEVEDAKLELNQGKDALVKARVTLHTVDPARVQTEIEAGKKITAKTREAGNAALKERDYRRMGLGVSVLAVLFAMVSLRLYIAHIENGGKS